MITKIKFLLAFCICMALNTYAQSKEELNTIRSLSLIELLYEDGSYSGCIAEAQLLEKNIARTPNLPRHYHIKTQVFLLKSYYAVLSFDKVTELLPKTLSAIESLSDAHDKELAYLYLTNFYNETGSFHDASLAFANCHSQSAMNDVWHKVAYEFEKITFLLGQNYLKEVQTELTEIKKLLYSHEMNDFTTDKELNLRLHLQRAHVQNLKGAYLLAVGDLEKAAEHFTIQSKWIADNVGRSNVEYSKCLALEGDMYYRQQEYKKAYSLYTDAYTSLPVSDYHKDKIYLLSKITSLSVFLEDVNAYEQYMRRLQLHADRNLYKYNFFQLAHGYADAYSYYSKGDYTTALSRLDRIYAKYPSLPGNHFFNQEALMLKLDIYNENGQISNYNATLDSLTKLSKEFDGSDSPVYYENLLTALESKIKSGKELKETEELLTNSYQKIIWPHTDSVSYTSLQYYNILSSLYFQTDRFALAQKSSDKAVMLSSNLYTESSWQYVQQFMKNIEYAAWAGNYVEALKKEGVTKKLDIYMQDLGNPLQYIKFCNQASINAYLLGSFDEHKAYSLKALKLVNKEHNNKKIIYANVREEAAATYIELSNLTTAELLLKQTLALRKQKLGDRDPSLFFPTKELSDLYLLIGNYSNADKITTEYLKLTLEVYGAKSIAYSLATFQSAKYSSAIGDNNKAKEMFEKCLKSQQALLGSKNLLLASTYIELAQINTKLNPENFVENEKQFKNGGSIIDNAIGKNNLPYVQYLQLLAGFYISNQKYTLANSLLTEADKYWQLKLGTKNVHIADIAMMFGKSAYMQSNYKEVDNQYNKARDIYETIFSNTHPSYCLATAQMAKVAYMQKDKNKALSLMQVCMPQYLAFIEKYFPSLSFQEKSKFWFSMKDEFEFYNFLILNDEANSKNKLTGNVYNNIIATKALLLTSDIKLRKQISTSGDTVLIRTFSEWLEQRELVSSMVSLSKDQMSELGVDPLQAETRLEELEKIMSARSSLFMEKGKAKAVKWTDVKAQLEKNEYAIEIFRYRYFDKVFSDSIIYGALILNHETIDGPEAVVMGNGKKMENRNYKYYRNSVINNQTDNYSYDIYWKSIKAVIPDQALIYLSSDGVYNQVNVEMFENTGTKKYVIDENEIVQVTNTKDIITETPVRQRKKDKIFVPTQYVLCGNPDFYANGNKGGNALASLQGAEVEVAEIEMILKAAGKTNLALLNKEVTEDTLMSFKSPKAMHIATHGYFKETPKNQTDNFANNPLLNSGLMLTGSGTILDNKENTYVNNTPGILTAYEVVNMNLDNTEIVVLSACETGKGQVEAGEGVYGLQRSFLIAGANCVIISLFKVNDEVTKSLMIEFYTNWLKSGDKRSAFNQAKRSIKAKYEDYPIFWGAFIMIEGKAPKKYIN